MKVLLDENLDHALRNLLGLHEVVTVRLFGLGFAQERRSTARCMRHHHILIR